MDLLVDLLVDLLADLLADLLVDPLAAWWAQEARPRWGNHAPPAGRRMGLPLKEARSRAPQLGFQSRPARSFRKMCPSRDYMPERAPPSSMVSASSLTQTRIASCGPTSSSNPGPTLLHGWFAVAGNMDKFLAVFDSIHPGPSRSSPAKRASASRSGAAAAPTSPIVSQGSLRRFAASPATARSPTARRSCCARTDAATSWRS
jgi:hypothetical protein